MHELQRVAAEPLVDRIAGDLGVVGAQVGIAAARVQLADQVATVLDQGPIALLAETQRRLGALAFRDVTRIDDDAAHGRRVEQIGVGRFEDPPTAVPVADPKFDRQPTPRPRAPSWNACSTTVTSSGWIISVTLCPIHSVCVYSSTRSIGGAHVGDGPVGAQHDDDVERVLDEGAEVLFTPLQVFLCTFAVGDVLDDVKEARPFGAGALNRAHGARQPRRASPWVTSYSKRTGLPVCSLSW